MDELETSINLRGVTDDDPNTPDSDDDSDYSTEELAKRMGISLPKPDAKPAARPEPADEPDEEPVEEPAEDDADADEPQGKPAEKPAEKPTDPDEEPRFTQKQLNAYMAQEKRITREAQAKLTQLQAATGMSVEQLMEAYRAQEARKLADEYGMVESEAKAIVEAQEKARRLEAEVAEIRAEQEAIKRQTTYQEQKAKYAANPHVKRYEAEIDRFAKENASWNFEVAVLAVLGQKVVSGELVQDVATTTRQQTISDVAKRKAGAVESPRQSGAPVDAHLPAETRRLTDAFAQYVPGLTRKGVAKQAERIKRQGRS